MELQHFLFTYRPQPSLLRTLENVGELSKGAGKVGENVGIMKWIEETPHVPFDMLLVPGRLFRVGIVK
jgi:hypothetical protein